MGLGINIYIQNKKWRKRNKHNGTNIGTVFNQELVSVGKESYGTINVLAVTNDSKLSIGSFCSIAEESMFVLSSDHRTDTISTFPFKAFFFHNGSEAISKGDIVVSDEVWIGYRSIIMSGVTIGQGAVVSAGSVVTRDVPAYAVVAGVPAKVVRYRFSEELVEELKK